MSKWGRTDRNWSNCAHTRVSYSSIDVCMYVCMHACVRACVHACMHVQAVCMYLSMYAYVCMCVRVCLRACVRTYIHVHCTYIHAHTHIHTYIHTYIHTCIHAHSDKHAHTHAYTHTHIGPTYGDIVTVYIYVRWVILYWIRRFAKVNIIYGIVHTAQIAQQQRPIVTLSSGPLMATAVGP